jgi:hypothetical protein
MKFSGIIFSTLALIFCFGCNNGDQPESLTNEQLEAFNYIPQESEFVLFMNINQLGRTDLWQNYFKKSLDSYQKQNWLSEFESATGIGMDDGIAEVYITASWAGNNLFIIRFDKNYDKIKYYFDTTFSSYLSNTKKIYFKESNPASEYYFANKSLLLIVNNHETVASITSNVFKSIIENGEMMAAINNIKRKKYYWMVTDKGSYASILISQLANSGGGEDTREMFSSIKSISLSASFELGAEFASIWQLSNDKDAFLFSVAIRSAISNYSPKNVDGRIKEILNSIKVKRDNDKVSLDLTVDQKDLSDIQNLLKQKMDQKTR